MEAFVPYEKDHSGADLGACGQRCNQRRGSRKNLRPTPKNAVTHGEKELATALEAAIGLADAALCRLEEEDLDTTTERELLAELWFIGARYSRQQNRRKE